MPRYARKYQRELPSASDAECLTLDEFCALHRISRQFYYKLRQLGKAPAEIHLGTRILISKEAARDWRAAREAESNTTAA